MGRKRKAGCVPVRRTPAGDWELLLVQSRWTPSVWLFPKGGVEDDEKGKAAAARETLEEGGVEGRLGAKLGEWATGSSSAEEGEKPRQRLKMWLLFVDLEHGPDAKAWKERKKRLRAWHSFESARAIFTAIPPQDRRPELVQILDAARDTLRDEARAKRAEVSDDLDSESDPAEDKE